MAATHPTPQLTEGSLHLLTPVGSGGSADVWRAVGFGGEPVALKVARTSEGAAALAREAAHASLALSPYLPELLDVGWLELDRGVVRILPAVVHPETKRPIPGPPSPTARAFLALRWIDGAPVGTPSDSRTALSLALRVAVGAGQALADLHGVGLSHGDVKPDNLLVDPEGDVHLIDLGLAGPAHSMTVLGATPRYLARGDADLGDARARDLAALGAVLAEIADPEVATATDPVGAARAARLPYPIGSLCGALLAPMPGARPSAAWVSETARAARALNEGCGFTADLDSRDRDARRVRAAYLLVRRTEIEHAVGVIGDDAAPWLAEAVERACSARAIAPSFKGPGGTETPEHLGPLGPEQLARWLTALVGSSATAWPLFTIAQVPERTIARTLTHLARRISPTAWTLRDVEDAIHGGLVDGPSDASEGTRREELTLPLDAERAATLALAIGRVPPDPSALVEVERRADAPASLVLAAADALRLRGEHGRARSLVLRDSVRANPAAGPLAADILRRAGDVHLAEQTARSVMDRGLDHDGRARAVLARLLLDRGEIDLALRLSEPARTAPLCEVAALAAARRGDAKRAVAEAARSQALAMTAEERARAAALRGYVAHGAAPAEVHAAFATAVDDAVRSGAVIEEATYRTGEAAAAVDLGELGAAIQTSRRAALLWEHLGKPALAARALLATAAAYATAGAAQDAVRAAREAMGRARDGGDPRAEAYAWWAIADVERARSPEGITAAKRASSILQAMAQRGGQEDELRAGARLLRHGGLDVGSIAELDRIAAVPSASVAARLDWWGVRAEIACTPTTPSSIEDGPFHQGAAPIDSPGILAALTAMADMPAPIGARGPALAAGVELAARTGSGDCAQRLLAALGEAARELVRRAPPDLAASIRGLPWVARSSAKEGAPRPEQARDLEVLIRSFSDRERLGPLLNRIVDALVLWTGVERGLLLLNAPDGRLVARAARNLARGDLLGEQMALSQTLARRALDAREPVVAVDAEGELSALHKSVHSLKLRSVLAVPLIARGEALGVVYLDDRIRRGAFGPREIEWARTIASLAALVIADARDQVLLRRAARRAKRASADIAETLKLREAALDVAERELARARGQRGTRFSYDNIVGESSPMRALLKLIDRVTITSVPVLVTGESGSGKELVARAIHDNGPRSRHAFVSENCGAIPETLLESALFGHVKGAYTGATSSRAGLFEVADRGTLFLDEIGEMTLTMQTKLLRILEDGMVRPVGSERTRKVDVRVIAATNRDLSEMVKAKTFREDLLYRLNIITLRVPPLRERPEDIPLLVQHLIDKHGEKGKARVTAAALDRLAGYGWPGNVRQLENEVRRALVLSDGVVDEDQLSTEILGHGSAGPTEVGLHVRHRIDALERRLVTEALDRTGGNQTQAAKLLGLSRFGLQKMIKRLEIE